MREPDRSCRTGAAAAATSRRRRWMDWLMVLVLMFMYFGIYLIHPFKRFVGSDMIAHLKYPLMTVTVPFWTVPLYAVVVPIAIFLLVYMRRRDAYDLHDAILGILFSVLVTGVLTETTKNAVGWPRPDFFWRCFPDGIEVYNRLGNVVCHGKKSFVLDGYKSFPSGHASWSFAGLGFLSLYLSGKLKVFEHGGHVAKLLLVLFPLLIAYVVGIFMVNDYMHHPQDVFFGSLMGLIVATLVYLQFYPSPYHHEDVFIPTSAQSRTNVQTSNIPTNAVGRSMDIEAPAPLENTGQ
ncbi:putative lipid phosphate phosphatase 3, chloroplastic [Benincasa hispida]|uniref:putative lipid phosphate phosphatase 3, chloroplastic n=1 Tax=Benincasa hispida TaxID=102211 RepID=UPI0019025138|nr:putative lipid phosphate phosphatase 3, chloroplastic [Benincasa hispida]